MPLAALEHEDTSAALRVPKVTVQEKRRGEPRPDEQDVVGAMDFRRMVRMGR
jgi:hypothetical protein